MKLSDLYLALASLFIAIEMSFTHEYGWMIGLGFLLVLVVYYGFEEGAE